VAWERELETLGRGIIKSHHDRFASVPNFKIVGPERVQRPGLMDCLEAGLAEKAEGGGLITCHAIGGSVEMRRPWGGGANRKGIGKVDLP